MLAKLPLEGVRMLQHVGQALAPNIARMIGQVNQFNATFH
jgi:hypothetical protein